MNTFGNNFRISIFGESHGAVVGMTADGVRPGMFLCADDFFNDLKRRKAGAPGTTPRIENDMPQIISGICDGHTTGAPLTVLFHNDNTRGTDYAYFRHIPRPGHSDYTANLKFQSFNDIRGGGHFSGRLTLGVVAAGTIAKKMLPDCTFSARLTEVGGQSAPEGSDNEEWYADTVLKAQSEGDSVGGIIECVCHGIPAGIGEPFFDSVESITSHIIFSVPGVRGIEFGDGFKSATMRGSEHNDPIIDASGKTSKNSAGGINGGLTNGNDLIFRVAIKPTSSIAAPQTSFNFGTGRLETFTVSGRHDACIALRCPVIIEAAAAIAIATLS